jgi:hypothetical protein
MLADTSLHFVGISLHWKELRLRSNSLQRWNQKAVEICLGTHIFEFEETQSAISRLCKLPL